jgi:hypothetical protein
MMRGYIEGIKFVDSPLYTVTITYSEVGPSVVEQTETYLLLKGDKAFDGYQLVYMKLTETGNLMYAHSEHSTNVEELRDITEDRSRVYIPVNFDIVVTPREDN